MQLGLVGLGRMGGNMRERIRSAGHEVIGYDRNPDVSDVASIAELVEKLAAPRVVWTMVPAGEITESTIDQLGELLSAGDVIIDGGNSKFTDDQPRADRLSPKGIGYMDCGVSGGIWGNLDGYPELAKLKGYAEDTGEGRWTVDEAVRLAVPLHVIAASLFTRFESRQIDSPAMKAVAALRQQFGGHAVVG